MRELSDAGIPVGLGIAPVVPGLNDSHIPALLRRAKEAGANEAFINLLRLPGSVAPYFEQRLRERLPTKADRVMSRLREARGGVLNNGQFGERMRGRGPYWEMTERVFRVHCKRLGFNVGAESSYPDGRHSTFRRPSAQATLFD
jgi:DNA repair photolyase